MSNDKLIVHNGIKRVGNPLTIFKKSKELLIICFHQNNKSPVPRKISSAQSSPDIDLDKDINTSQSEDEEKEFMEELKKLQEELQDAESERDEAVALANELYNQLCEAENK